MSLQELDLAPDFTAFDQNGKPFTLSAHRGKKLLLYFYPKDNTTVCTKQACNLRDNYEELLSHGLTVIGISPDDAHAHNMFIKKFDLPFDLLIDADHKISEAYGVWQEKTMYGRKYMGIVRTSFIIDENGKIEKIIDKVKADDHSRQVIGK